MNVSVIVATYGDRKWADLGQRALASVEGQGAHEVFALHLDYATLTQVRNEAVEGATGDWLCFVDADDRLGTGYLQAMAERYRSRTWDYVGPLEDELYVPAVQYVTPEGQCLSQPRIPDWGKPLIEINCAVIGTLIPRRLFLQVGGFRELPALEDWDLWVRCMIAGARLVPVEGAVYCANAGVFSRRNRDQSGYWKLRAEHEEAWRAATR